MVTIHISIGIKGKQRIVMLGGERLRQIRRTSNSVPRPVLMVVGEKDFHTIVSQMLVAMNNEMPEPSP